MSDHVKCGWCSRWFDLDNRDSVNDQTFVVDGYRKATGNRIFVYCCTLRCFNAVCAYIRSDSDFAFIDHNSNIEDPFDGK